MTWTYSCDPCSSEKDEVRFLVGDTDTNQQLIKDEEIAYLLKKYGSPLSAAVNAARSISASVSKQVTEKTGDIAVSLGDLAEQYRKLANELQNQLSETATGICVTGVSHSEIDSRNSNEDRVSEQFQVGMDDDPRSISQDNFGY